MNSFVRLGMVVAAVLIAACDSGLDSSVSEAKKRIESDLRDPESVQYRNLKRYSDGTVCGEFNAKNGYGGYVGFKEFSFYKGNLDLTGKDSFIICSDLSDKTSRILGLGTGPVECEKAKAEASGQPVVAGGGMTPEQLRVKAACGEK